MEHHILLELETPQSAIDANPILVQQDMDRRKRKGKNEEDVEIIGPKFGV